MDLKLNREKLLDKLGERWLFEKKGVALYALILRKLAVLGFAQDYSPLENYARQEKQHEELLEDVIRKLGGSPHHRTPSQLLVEQEARAFENIVNESDDPMHLLHVLLDAELQDNASWELLVSLCKEAGEAELTARFQGPLKQEIEHLDGVRAIVKRAALADIAEGGPRSPTIRRLTKDEEPDET